MVVVVVGDGGGVFLSLGSRAEFKMQMGIRLSLLNLCETASVLRRSNSNGGDGGGLVVIVVWLNELVVPHLLHQILIENNLEEGLHVLSIANSGLFQTGDLDLANP
ncbi:hypothetical protein M0804_003270 [Polistes exclamans]|nr:hypothetical protein M0804_003270 [Polistes exclamans]